MKVVLLGILCSTLQSIENVLIVKSVGLYALEKMQPRVLSFEDQVATLRQHLALVYEKEHNWRQAASILVSNIGSTLCPITSFS